MLVADPGPAAAAPDGFLTEPQRVIAEVWKGVDAKFVDRTFNHQDWFALRQKYVHRDYQSVSSAYLSAAEMLSKLDDPYTRFLSPTKFASLIGSATASIAGVGVELLQDSGIVLAGDVEPNSPAAAAGGLVRGDIFESIDGEPIRGLQADDVAGEL
jgi:carboxyl-terminal processing protease